MDLIFGVQFQECKGTTSVFFFDVHVYNFDILYSVCQDITLFLQSFSSFVNPHIIII